MWRKNIGKGKSEQPMGNTQLPAARLRVVDIFRDLSMQEIEMLFKGVMLRECRRGVVIFTPEEASEALFFVKEGLIDIYRLTPAGKRLVIQQIGPGAIFGEMGVLGQSMQRCFAEAAQDSVVCLATKDDVLKALRTRPDVAIRLLESIGKRVTALEERLEGSAFSSVRVRLAKYLVSEAEPATNSVQGVTHEKIGDTIGSLRQTVTETLSEMQKKGLIETSYRRIKILNRRALEEIAEGEGQT